MDVIFVQGAMSLISATCGRAISQSPFTNPFQVLFSSNGLILGGNQLFDQNNYCQYGHVYVYLNNYCYPPAERQRESEACD